MKTLIFFLGDEYGESARVNSSVETVGRPMSFVYTALLFAIVLAVYAYFGSYIGF
jgi:hypothetical protein